MKRSSIEKIIAPFEIYVQKFNFTVKGHYYPGKFTPQFEAAVFQTITRDDQTILAALVKDIAENTIDSSSTDEQVEKVANSKPSPVIQNYACQMLATLMADWDITDDDDVALPINQEELFKTPYIILRAVLDGIKEDMSPKATS